MATLYRCPQCGSADTFHAHPCIEHHTSEIDAQGTFVQDIDCYEWRIAEDATFTCTKCNHRAPRMSFILAASRENRTELPTVTAILTHQRVNTISGNAEYVDQVEFDCTAALTSLLDATRANDYCEAQYIRFAKLFLCEDAYEIGNHADNLDRYEFADRLFAASVDASLVSDWTGPFELEVVSDDNWQQYRKLYIRENLHLTDEQIEEIG